MGEVPPGEISSDLYCFVQSDIKKCVGPPPRLSCPKVGKPEKTACHTVQPEDMMNHI